MRNLRSVCESRCRSTI
ncbi:hypothetical protein R3I94_002498 [Phoxinus phoxinus]|uniref:Uncharacterized protein n=1 Tax=Phoxinus phoxinus TaxID=58324 RepID=A0AAN9DK65_9TELE